MKKHQKNQVEEGIPYQIAGWILFIICATLFIASSLKNHDMLTFIGSIFFFVACILFLVPIVKAYKITEDDVELHDDN